MSRVKKNIGLAGRIWKLIRKIALSLLILSVVWVALLRFIPVYFTPLMIIRSFQSVFDGKTMRNAKHWVSIDEISPNMVQAVVASEDNLFLTHHGFSFDEMRKAFDENKKRKIVRGGSTISQQTAKNVFLWPNKSYFRKGLEAYFTVLIELIWSKERIMEVYLNVIEMGEGIYGVQAASEVYFNKSASQLTRQQAALIAVCLPNPRRFKVSAPSSYILKRQGKVLSLMNKIEKVDFDKKVKPKKVKYR
jgi:monofunctional biosynthetic peptidoglycan transglycosylase